MRTFTRTLLLGGILLTIGLYAYSPSVARALIDPRYTPPYWTR